MANLVQSASVASSAASPATITPTLGAASTKGNLLLISVVVSGSATAITTPAGWTLINSLSTANNLTNLYALPNNAGSITAVAIAITATGGGAAASIFEWGGVQGQVLEASSGNSAGGQTSISAGSAAAAALPRVNQVGELSILVIGDNDTGAAAIPTTTGEYGANTAPAVSAAGTPNVRIATFFAINGGTDTPQLLSATLGGSTNYGFIVARFTAGGLLIGYGAGGAVFVGQSLNPAGPLQVPQPIAPGNFFSGTTGSF